MSVPDRANHGSPAAHTHQLSDRSEPSCTRTEPACPPTTPRKRRPAPCRPPWTAATTAARRTDHRPHFVAPAVTHFVDPSRGGPPPRTAAPPCTLDGMTRAAVPAEVVEMLGDVARFGPYFEIVTDPGEIGGAAWRPFPDLDALLALTGEYGERPGTKDPPITPSPL